MTGAALDLRGLRCPWPVLRAARALREGGGAGLAVRLDDERAVSEIHALAAAQGRSVRTVDDWVHLGPQTIDEGGK
ncbi:sulfurtransferase TusA family protein [Sphingomonas morindae]|uniref:Sulfurtransferase TusA family protein n=1 Tax=Sphingomonas morindae TaxID=1541170 RepID=A0ABY4X9M7_9SPHN|nr:sulfurtransferase TusA family protein [Sphingomonas morindae]USI73649.1 sulfurtransferase TusA family protein [Sphingomonas morindae]